MRRGAGLTSAQKETYDGQGFVVLEGLLSDAECDGFVAHMVDLHAGRERLEGFEPRQPGGANECMSAWLAFVDVDRDNGTIQVQPGSHRQRLLTRTDFEAGGQFHGWDYNDAVEEQFEHNRASGQVGEEVPVEVLKGSVVFAWPHRSWWRYTFDGARRQHPAP